MSTCVCTPKQKATSRFSKRCAAHHGHQVPKFPKKHRWEFGETMLGDTCLDCGLYKSEGRRLYITSSGQPQYGAKTCPGKPAEAKTSEGEGS